MRKGMHDYNCIKKDRTIFLDNMRAIAIFMVVAVHSMGYCGELLGDKDWISFIVHTISVPVFFLVDGYLFAQKNSFSMKYKYLTYIKKSGHRLLVPWLFFVSAYSVLRYIFELNGFLPEKILLGLPIFDVIKNSYGSVIAPQLYFLFSLFIIRLATPLTKQLFKVDKQTALLISLSLIVIYYSTVDFITPYLKIQNGQEPFLHALWGAQYYLLGINLFLFKDFINVKFAFFGCFLFFCITYITNNYLLTFHYMGIFIQYSYLLSFYFVFKLIPINTPLLNSIGKNTMGIFLLHAPILIKIISLLVNNFIKQPLTSFMSITFSTFVASYLITLIISSVPYGSLLFGLPNKKNLITGC